MHPDRRRAGRAIRKSRRLNRDVSSRFAEFAAAARQAGDAMRHFAESFIGVAVELRSTPHGVGLRTVPRAASLATAAAGAGHPSQSGVTHTSEAPVASEGVEPK